MRKDLLKKKKLWKKAQLGFFVVNKDHKPYSGGQRLFSGVDHHVTCMCLKLLHFFLKVSLHVSPTSHLTYSDLKKNRFLKLGNTKNPNFKNQKIGEIWGKKLGLLVLSRTKRTGKQLGCANLVDFNWGEEIRGLKEEENGGGAAE